jgi:hypothetical protein
MVNRRFPTPWSIEELNDACVIVKDSAGQKLAYVYFEDEPGRRSAARIAETAAKMASLGHPRNFTGDWRLSAFLKWQNIFAGSTTPGGGGVN